MAGQQESSFLESFGRVIGQLPMGIKSPLMEKTIELQLAKEKKLLDEQLARQQIALDQVVELERKKELAESHQTQYGNKFEAEGLHGPIPEFSNADELKLYQQYGYAGMNPKEIAEAKEAEFRADQFAILLNEIKDPAQRANILNKLDAAAFRQSGDTNYNRFTGDTTLNKKGLADQRKAIAAADLAETQTKYALKFMNDPSINPIIRAEYARNGSVLKTEKAEIVGEDGKTYMADTILMPGGNRQLTKVTDAKTGALIEIPPEATGEGLTSEQKNILNRARILGISEEEALQTLNNRSQHSDLGFIEHRLTANTQGRFGRNSDLKVFTATFDDFRRARYGSYFPDYFEDEIKRSKTMSDKEKEELIADIDAYNQKVSAMQLVSTKPPTPGTITNQSKAMQATTQQKDDARYGELGIIKNKNGAISTEFSITENIPELGGWVNIPTLVQGQTDLRFLETGQLTSDNVKIAVNRAIDRVKNGAFLPSYNSLEEAVKASENRTEQEKMMPFSAASTLHSQTAGPTVAMTTDQAQTQPQGQPFHNLSSIQFPKPNLPSISQPNLTMASPPTLTPEPLPGPQPAPDFMAFAETVMTHNSPAEINAALKKQGFDLSPQAMGIMAIDAVNQGVNVQDIQQLYQLLGIQWTPPA